jgi:Ca2+-binding RTX toxin-like protein
VGGAGADKLKGGKGDDLLVGGPGDDDLKGEHGDDVLLGGTGADKLKGGKGDDVLDGGEGQDHLIDWSGKHSKSKGNHAHPDKDFDCHGPWVKGFVCDLGDADDGHHPNSGIFITLPDRDGKELKTGKKDHHSSVGNNGKGVWKKK